MYFRLFKKVLKEEIMDENSKIEQMKFYSTIFLRLKKENNQAFSKFVKEYDLNFPVSNE